MKNINDISVDFVDFCISRSKEKTTIPIFNNDRKLCPHPWVGFHILPGGEVSPCCEYNGVITDDSGIPYNVNKDSYDDILYSNYMNNLRNQFRENKNPDSCIACWSSELDNRMQISPYRLGNIYGNIDWESEGKQEYLGGHLGNLCNFGCVICSAYFSSTIAAEDLQMFKYEDKKSHPSFNVLKNNTWPSRNKEFWNSVRNNFNQIKNFELLGGEPFLLEENLQLIKDLVNENLAKDVILQISTNGSQFPDVCNLLNHFKQTIITLSIDNLDQKFEYERYRSSWQTLINVASKFFEIKNQSSNIKVNACITVSILNVLDLPETIQWIKSQNFDNYYLNFVFDPKELSLDYITKATQESLLSKFSNYTSIPEIRSVINLLKNSKLSNGKEFCDYIQNKEKFRKNSLKESHPEISELMGYNLI